MARKTRRAESRARYFVRDVAKEKGWDIRHLQRGGDVLEEQECAFIDHLGLGLKRPDFLFCINNVPVMVVETKNERLKADEAIAQAEDYCDIINKSRHYQVNIAVGVAGEPDHGFIVKVKFLHQGCWKDLKAKGYPLTALPSKQECLNAIEADDTTTELTIPSFAEFVDAAVDISNILHTAKIEPTLRPKVVGAITTALYQGEISPMSTSPLEDINNLMSMAIRGSSHFSDEKKIRLIEALTLGVNDFDRLSPYLMKVISILKKLNVRSVLQSDADFLGMFYEAFLRYGADNNAMGIVFTPRHITRLCVDLVGVDVGQKVIDVTCGTGGFLVSAFDKLKNEALNRNANNLIRESIYGFDTNPTVWALSCLNMFFRGDGKSHIENVSSLLEESRSSVANSFHKAFLNPPFHQEGEPERDFIDASMDALIQGGLFAGVIYAGVFADKENSEWRAEFMRRHTLLAMISLPDELFYPNASAITTIMIAKAHVPQPVGSKIFMGRLDNDGFVKLKGKRVSCPGSKIPELKKCFAEFMRGQSISSDFFVTVDDETLRKGMEFSPQAFLPQPAMTLQEVKRQNSITLMSLFQTVASFPDITDALNEHFADTKKEKRVPLGKTQALSTFFDVETGKSSGLKTYSEGISPYVSSGDGTNGVVGMVSCPTAELCQGCISVSAFGTAYLQPWNYYARGNGGSSVRVLVPKYKMSVRELFWFIAQINSQRWRFTYARQAIKSRLLNLQISSPPSHLDEPLDIIGKINDFKTKLSELSIL
ncbi:MAG: N-6 DNA methylase [Bacteroidaceae bacterium]|nr:N-6 DNA methylase [Bacteroidaceae bacterium]